MTSKERPIIMTPDNAQRCFRGVKTQTRRIIKPQPNVVHGWNGEWLQTNQIFRDGSPGLRCPFGLVGDRLWIRENGWERPERTPKMLRDGADTWEPFYYDALLIDGEADELKQWGFKRRPSIHMPRWACRTVVEITKIRVERLNDISERDAIAEGVEPCGHTSFHVDEYTCSFKELWATINGPGSWALNPWVWCLTFEKVAV